MINTRRHGKRPNIANAVSLSCWKTLSLAEAEYWQRGSINTNQKRKPGNIAANYFPSCPTMQKSVLLSRGSARAVPSRRVEAEHEEPLILS